MGLLVRKEKKVAKEAAAWLSDLRSFIVTWSASFSAAIFGKCVKRCGEGWDGADKIPSVDDPSLGCTFQHGFGLSSLTPGLPGGRVKSTVKDQPRL